VRPMLPRAKTFSKEKVFKEECIHIGIKKTEDAVGLAFSGGGVRAATFALGVLQGLTQKIDNQRRCLLDDVDYISSVSGGGYIASWLSQQITNCGYQETRDALRAPVDTKVATVRSYGSYLTPQRGFFSTDTWRMVAGYLVRLVPNLLFIGLALTSLILMPYLIRNWTNIAVHPHIKHWSIGAWLWLPCICLAVHAFASFATGIPAKMRTAGSLFLIVAFITAIPLAVWIDAGDYWFLGARDYSEKTVILHRRQLIFSIAVITQGALAVFGAWRLREANHKARLIGGWITSTLAGWTSLSVALSIINWLWLHSMREVTLAVAPLLFSISYLAICAVWTYWVPFDDDDQEFINSLWATTASLSLGWALIALVCCVAPHYLTPYFINLTKGDRQADWQSRLSVVLATVGAIAASLHSVFYDDSKVAVPQTLSERVRQKKQAAGDQLRSAIAGIAPYLVLISMLVLAAMEGPWLLRWLEATFPGHTVPDFELAVCILSAGLAVVVGSFMDLNRLSMKNFYRSRLTTAYLEDKSVLLSDIADKDVVTERRIRPYPILNCAMNVTSESDLSVQSIRSRNFIFSPLFCGFHAHSAQKGLTREGYRPTTEYLSKMPPRVRLKERKKEAQVASGIRLNDPMTLSGAAANPAMGFHTSPALSFLLAMFNVRLGAWVGNPRHRSSYQHTASSGAPNLLVDDFLGRTGDGSKYLMLSDGGHFENTGVYELIRRRSRLIFCCDSGCDGEYVFGDLLHLVERCQIDFGVTIIIPEMYHLRPFGRTGYARSNFTIATVQYDRGATGYLVIFKPTVTRDACETVRSFDRENASFPQVSTADQWFYESEFEAYRLLGTEVVASFVDALYSESQLDFSPDSVFQRVAEMAPRV
jgi:hypothetical protein